jgi:regulatory protein
MRKKQAEPRELSKEEIILKLEHWCSYRERCESEVRQKLFLMKVPVEENGEYFSHLRENNFLNEDRYAAAFARGKFNIKSWGRRKIEQQLKSKNISEKKITQSIGELDEGLYFLRLQDVLLKKNKTLREADPHKRKYKLMQYAMQKGYEPGLIQEAIKTISF